MYSRDVEIFEEVSASMSNKSGSLAESTVLGLLQKLARRHGDAFSIDLACAALSRIEVVAREIKNELLRRDAS